MAALVVASPRVLDSQAATSSLRITVTLTARDQSPSPVRRHALLISDDPPSGAPKRVITGVDGTATVRLAPGTYTVESDRPVAFEGTQYEWRQTVAVKPGQDATLALTAENAERGAVTAASAEPETKATRTADAYDIAAGFENSVLAVWTPIVHATAFLVDAKGLLATNQQVIGPATAVEVQVTPDVKLSARVLTADKANDVAVLWVDPAAVASIKPVPLDCGKPLKPPLANGTEIVSLGMPPYQPARLATGLLTRVSTRAMVADLGVRRDAAGGPVFTAAGHVVGLTSFTEAADRADEHEGRVVRLDAICDAVATATTAMAKAAPPDATKLPMEPTRVVPQETLKEVTKTRAGALSPYAMSLPTFDVAFLTPVITYAGVQGNMDFANWTEYVGDQKSVLLVRVTPKQAEKLWTTIARGVARTQGIAVPPIKRFVTGFGRLRVKCGATEVAPIHPFLLERRVGETDAVYEGLYVFDPGAIGPHCPSVTLEVSSDKTPEKPESAALDPKISEQIWQDFAPYRALKQ